MSNIGSRVKKKGWEQDKAKKGLLKIWEVKRKHYGESQDEFSFWELVVLECPKFLEQKYKGKPCVDEKFYMIRKPFSLNVR